MQKREIPDVLITGMARTPIGNFMGAFSSLTALELAEVAGRAALARSGVPPAAIGEVVMGMVYKHGLKGNPARQLQLALGIPVRSGAVTVEQQCASGMRALEIACQQIQLGHTQAALVCGAESMSNVPFLMPHMRKGWRLGADRVEDALYHDALIDAFSGVHMMQTAEDLAAARRVGRRAQDEYALLSQKRALRAQKEGLFCTEIVPVEVKTKKGAILVDTDEHPRETSRVALAKLPPAHKPGGTVTVGNASGLNDGACAVVLVSEMLAKELGIQPQARVVSTATVGCEPAEMGIGPVYAIPEALHRAGITPEQVDYYEINEAFAAQVLPCIKELDLDLADVNAVGSGISLGHPVGMTGLRLVVTGYYELARRGGRYGCASLCAGGGPAMATVFERLA